MSRDMDALAEHGLDLLANDPGHDKTAARELEQAGVDPAALLDTLHLISAAAPAVRPPPALKARLMESISKVNRFEWAVDRFAAMLRVGVAKARELLMAMDEPTSWKPGPVPGCELYFLEAGFEGALAGFVRFQPGVTFPHHLHKGEENVLVLQGSMKDDVDGSVLRTGQGGRQTEGSEHSITALPGPPCIYAAVVITGIDIPGYQL